jgi:hypothetical protein
VQGYNGRMSVELNARNTQRENAPRTPEPMSLPRVVGALQVMLATRRAARNAEHAFWYSVTRDL